MPLDQRPYMQTGRPYGGGGFGLPRPPRVTLAVILACAVVFLLGITPELRARIVQYASLPADRAAEVWRLITFQFVHGDPRHLLFNLLGLYFFAPPLERAWGSRRFLVFYLSCGVFAGLSFLLLAGLLGSMRFLVGASGGMVGCLIACAILYPSFLVIVFPIRWVAGFYALLFLLGLIYERDLADAAHLGGAVAGAVWVWLGPRARSATGRVGKKLRQGAWQRRLQRRQTQQEEIDRILQKVHDRGLESLSHKERRTLQEASRRQREDEHRLRRL